MFIQDSSFHVLYTNNLHGTHAFYTAVGADIKLVEDDKVVVQLGDYSLHFILTSTEPFEEYKYIGQKLEFGNGVLFYTQVDDLESAFERVKQAGGTIKSEIKDNHWESQEFLFEDPNGFKFAFYK